MSVCRPMARLLTEPPEMAITHGGAGTLGKRGPPSLAGKANPPCAGSDARMPSEHLRVGVYTDKPHSPPSVKAKIPLM